MRLNRVLQDNVTRTASGNALLAFGGLGRTQDRTNTNLELSLAFSEHSSAGSLDDARVAHTLTPFLLSGPAPRNGAAASALPSK